MAATQHDTRLNPRKLLPALALATGLIAASLVAAAPAGVFDAVVEGVALGAFAPAGTTGRMLMAIAAGGLVALLGALPLLAPRRRRATRLGAIPLLRRADAHPDAPARRPIAAHSELGAPVLLIDARTAEHGQPIPADLDQPLAAFDPGAVPAVPRAPVRAVRSLAPVQREPLPAGEGEASIGALLDRLERAAARRAAARIDGLEDMLVKLRKLAAG